MSFAVSSTVKAEKKEVYGSRAGSNARPASPRGGNDKLAESLQSIFELALKSEGPERTARLLEDLSERLHAAKSEPPRGFNTSYVNTIPVEEQAPFPGDWQMERKIKSYIRWNAM